MEEMECSECGHVSLPRVYETADKKHVAWECVEEDGGCGVICPPDNWVQFDEDDEEEDDDAES